MKQCEPYRPASSGCATAIAPVPREHVSEHQVSGVNPEQLLGSHITPGERRLVESPSAETADAEFRVAALDLDLHPTTHKGCDFHYRLPRCLCVRSRNFTASSRSTPLATDCCSRRAEAMRSALASTRATILRCSSVGGRDIVVSPNQFSGAAGDLGEIPRTVGVRERTAPRATSNWVEVPWLGNAAVVVVAVFRRVVRGEGAVYRLSVFKQWSNSSRHSSACVRWARASSGEPESRTRSQKSTKSVGFV